jgi:hypothetical protein
MTSARSLHLTAVPERRRGWLRLASSKSLFWLLLDLLNINADCPKGRRFKSFPAQAGVLFRVKEAFEA